MQKLLKIIIVCESSLRLKILHLNGTSRINAVFLFTGLSFTSSCNRLQLLSKFIDHNHYMQRALALAKKGRGLVEPNPLVGCVIVKDDYIIGEGYHARFGGDHAEVAAIKNVTDKKAIAGATMYVTLEPCNHTGKTPPCAKAIVAAGVSKVIIAVADQNQQASGGTEYLQKHGVEVITDVLRSEATELNRAFFISHKYQRPFITAKIAVSQNNMVAAANGEQTQITGPEAQKYLHEKRSEHTAILVGANTIRVDDPQLNVRFGKNLRQPLKIILEGKHPLSRNYKIFRNDNYLRFVPQKSEYQAGSSHQYTEEVAKATDHRTKNNIVIVDRDDQGHVDLQAVMKELHQKGIQSVLVEGGPQILQSFEQQNLIDRLIVLRSSKILPSNGVLMPPLWDKQKYLQIDSFSLGDDTSIIYNNLSQRF
jgi:diaminohydroxyphosphoribosylaminopyrimidine deaminase/5-amino-6-(5-phosphoribosylamino)uracil reductase